MVHFFNRIGSEQLDANENPKRMGKPLLRLKKSYGGCTSKENNSSFFLETRRYNSILRSIEKFSLVDRLYSPA